MAPRTPAGGPNPVRARLLDEMGDKEAARAEYEHFLELWEDADPDLPELKETREYLAN